MVLRQPRRNILSRGQEPTDLGRQGVAEWFTKTNAKLVEQYNKVIPSLIFVHIPTHVSLVAQTKAGIDPSREPGINDDNPMFYQAEHYCSDGSQSKECKGVMQKLLSAIWTVKLYM